MNAFGNISIFLLLLANSKINQKSEIYRIYVQLKNGLV